MSAMTPMAGAQQRFAPGMTQQQPQATPPQASPESLVAVLTSLMQQGPMGGGPKGAASVTGTGAGAGSLQEMFQQLLHALAGPPKPPPPQPPDPVQTLMQVLGAMGIGGSTPGGGGAQPQGGIPPELMQMFAGLLGGGGAAGTPGAPRV